MQADLVTRFKDRTPGRRRHRAGGVAGTAARAPATHGDKYRAAYAVDGVRIVGFDNELDKGDHCHVGGIERPYAFTTVERLDGDFIAAVAAAESTP